MKEEEEKFNQFDERITNMERKILDMDEKYEHRSEDNKKEHVDENQGKTVITGFHIETTESEVTQLLREMYQDVEDEVDELMLKWQTKNSSQRL